MSMTSVRVPGKAMLSGEYAVLHGGTAVLLPVPRYLAVVESKMNISSHPQSPVVRNSLDRKIRQIEDYELAHPLLGVDIDSSAFFWEDKAGNAVKLGLGLSAAEAVGIVALRFERAGFDWTENREKVAEYAEIIHREAQGGIGSGADVLACAYGEPIRFRRDGESFLAEPMPKSSVLPPLHLAWTGKPADTRQMVADFDSWLSQDRLHASILVRDLVDSSHELAAAWFTSPTDDLFACLDRFCSVLRNCTRAAGIPHRLSIHHRLEVWARSHGGRAKPTGAGGGDMVLLVGNLPVNELDMMVIPLDVR